MIEQLRQLIPELSAELKGRNLKIATAESCTGGGLSYWMTSIPGSSDWFERGFVTYSNDAKTEMLGVKPITINTFGAVSEQTAREMAEGALKHSHANIGVAITGIAGPDGGTPHKPVGTVFIAWARKNGTTDAQAFHFSGDRQEIRLRSMVSAIVKLIEMCRY